MHNEDNTRPWILEYTTNDGNWSFVSTFKRFKTAAEAAPCKKFWLKKNNGFNMVIMRLRHRQTGWTVLEPQFNVYKEKHPVKVEKNDAVVNNAVNDLIQKVVKNPELVDKALNVKSYIDGLIQNL